MAAPAQRKKTNRVERVNSLIQHLLGNILLPYIKNQEGITTVTKVQTSGDMRWVKVWISVVAGNEEKVLKTLQNNIYDIQGELNRSIEMKIVPRITFLSDASAKYADHISQIFHEIENERTSGQSEGRRSNEQQPE